MPKDESIHILFDEINGNIIVSPSLVSIFHFLMNIEKDITFVLNQEERFNLVKVELKKLLGYTANIAKIAEESNLKLEPPNDINFDLLIDQFKYRQPAIVGEMLSIFAFLETIYCLFIAYSYEISDKEEILDYTMNTKLVKKFIAEFLLSTDNPYFKKNRKYLGKLTPQKLRNFRNSLVHFYSVSGGINIIHKNNAKLGRKLEVRLKGTGAVFISSTDLYGLTLDGAKLLLKSWSNNFLKNSKDFERRIQFVSSIVDENAGKFIMENELKI